MQQDNGLPRRSNGRLAVSIRIGLDRVGRSDVAVRTGANGRARTERVSLCPRDPATPAMPTQCTSRLWSRSISNLLRLYLRRFFMNISAILSGRPRSLFLSGVLLGVVVVVALSTSPPDDPPRRSFRPNISTFHLPKKLDFCGESVPLDDREVRKRMDREFLLNLQWDGQVMLYLKRSGEYFDLFDRILKEEGVPEDLKFLSVAESALFMAQSSKGAVGLWQFIPETGRRYGLRVDDAVDERRDPEKSTRAAVRYLKDNYQRFGSWSLAACAYNQGEGATADDITFQRGTDFYDLYLNEETSRYLFRIVAIKEIMTHPERYGYYLERGTTTGHGSRGW